jgi:hypothetical protein
MTRKRAFEILLDFWGSGETLTASVVKEIEAIEKSGESALETVAKVAGLWDSHIRHLKAYDNQALRSIVSRAWAEYEIEIANKPWLR